MAVSEHVIEGEIVDSLDQFRVRDRQVETWRGKALSWLRARWALPAQFRGELDAYARRRSPASGRPNGFSWWMTQIRYRFPKESGFDQRIQRAEFECLFSSRSAQTALAENDVGPPY
jgi:hypothetical protein